MLELDGRDRRRPRGRAHPDGTLRAPRADRPQEREGRGHRGRPPLRGADHRRHPTRVPRRRASWPRSRALGPGEGRARQDGAGASGPVDADHASGSSTRSTGPSTTPTASRCSASASRWSSAAGRSSASSTTRRATSSSPRDRRARRQARRVAHPPPGEGELIDAVISLALPGRGFARRERRDPQGRPRDARSWAAPRSRWRTSPTAASTPSSRGAGCRSGTSPRPASIAAEAGATVTDGRGGPWFDLARRSRAIGIVAAPPPTTPRSWRCSDDPCRTRSITRCSSFASSTVPSTSTARIRLRGDRPRGRHDGVPTAKGSDNHHDLGLLALGPEAPRPPRGSTGLYHLAWEVPTIDDLAAAASTLSELRALVGASDHGATKSLYGRDPDGNEFEVMWLVPRDAWGSTSHGV